MQPVCRSVGCGGEGNQLISMCRVKIFHLHWNLDLGEEGARGEGGGKMELLN